ncbi:MAG TPA: S41 family peptidase [Candidatus Eremiobacteraeota bacterium]|nr:S41 family peptidase [Candidatus Eremiobacteraeota bacterium]
MNLKLKILILFLILLTCQFVLAKDNRRVNIDLLIDVYKVIEKSFVSDINREKLINAALNSIELFLKEKTDSVYIKEIEVSGDRNADLELFALRLKEITSKYSSENLRPEDILREGLDGMLKALDDPYSYYMDPEEYREFFNSINMSDYSGVGIIVELDKKNDNKFTVIETVQGGPGEKGGLKPGDLIVSIDGYDTKGITIEDGIKRIRGPKGTEVLLSIQRGERESFDIALTRDVIHVTNVSYSIKNENIGYIKIRTFGDNTACELEKVLEKLRGVKAYILDLRNNGGGYIESAVDVCSKFLPEGKVIVTVKEKSSFPLTYKTRGKIHYDLPLVVLVNQYSASASEITAGAIQDNKRGTLMGVKTFGKGSVQTVYPLGISGVLKLTGAYYFTPSNRNIDKAGLEPDIKIEMDKLVIENESDDIQLQKAIEFFLEKV